MDSKQMEVVSQGLQRMNSSPNAVAKSFLARLRKTDPALAKVFGAGRMACGRLRLLVQAAERGENTAAVRHVARHWRAFPVGYRDYATVGAVMLWAVREVLGNGFTLAARGAWLAFHVRAVLLLQRAARIGVRAAA